MKIIWVSLFLAGFCVGGAMAATESEATTTTDSVVIATQGYVNNRANSAINSATDAAKVYTDGQITDVRGYVDTQTASAIKSATDAAKTYTDDQITDVREYVDTQANSVPDNGPPEGTTVPEGRVLFWVEKEDNIA